MKKGDIVYKAAFPDKTQPDVVQIIKYTIDRVEVFKKPKALIKDHPTIKDKKWLTVKGFKVPAKSACITIEQAYREMDKALGEYKTHTAKILADAIKKKKEAIEAVAQIEKKLEEGKEIEYKRAISVRKVLAQYK
jgi:hypothetical protein